MLAYLKGPRLIMNIFPYFLAHFIRTFSGRPPKCNKWPISGKEPGTSNGLDELVSQKLDFLKIMRHKRRQQKRMRVVIIFVYLQYCTERLYTCVALNVLKQTLVIFPCNG